MGLEITVIDDSDHVGWAAAATRLGEIYMTDVTDMVTNVLARIGTSTMSRLNILDHGNPQLFEIGSDMITVATLINHEPQLSRLNGHFDKSGFVHLQHCQIGQNQDLLLRLARIFGAPVYAGLDFQNAVYRINMNATIHTGWLTGWTKAIPNPFAGFERYVRADPDGTFHNPVDRP